MNNFFKIKRVLAVCILFFYASFIQGFAMDVEEPKAIIKVHNVGQGNCITLEAKDKDGNSQYMIVDVGSTAFAKEFKLLDQTSQQLTPPHSPTDRSTSAPGTIKKSIQLPATQKNTKGLKEGVQEEIRQALGQRKSAINIKTIIITHPDKDHYGWLSELLKKDDMVENIILGGLPENYNLKTLELLRDRIEGTNIFFPVMGYSPIQVGEDQAKLHNEIGELINQRDRERKLEKKETNKKIKEKIIELIKGDRFTLAVQACSNEDDGIIVTDTKESVSKKFQKAFAFKKSPVKIYMLSINPLHFQGKRGIVRCYDGDEDDNKESLVMKIVVEDSSVILTGDATQATINRIIDNYGRDSGFFKTDVLLASHHGASTHGSNSQEWLNLTHPKYVLISNGLSYGHPSEEAYKRFHEPVKDNLVKRHNVLVGKAVEREKGGSYKEGTLHKTKASIFSTLTSGTITVGCMETGVKISTEKDGDIGLKEEKSKLIEERDEEENDEEVAIEEKGNNIFVTPKSSHSKTLNSGSSSGEDLLPQNLFGRSLSDESFGDVGSKEESIVVPKETTYPQTIGGFLSFLNDKGYSFSDIAQKVSPGTYLFNPERLRKIASGEQELSPVRRKELWALLIKEFFTEWEEF